MPPSYDAVIVLGNLMSAQGQLNPETKARVDLAIVGLGGSLLVTCGWNYRADTPICIADAMKAYALGCGIPDAQIITEPASRDTVGDAVFTRRNLGETWRSILVVTSDYHAERAKSVFSFVYGPAVKVEVIAAESDAQGMADDESRSLEAFRATFNGVATGDIEAIYSRLTERHPFYNGAADPRVFRQAQ
ncbi:MAG: YdcF family protein [Burkholderiaceae bacterium]|nr:YdcF family protein [Burkholderiaceae bacterium]